MFLSYDDRSTKIEEIPLLLATKDNSVKLRKIRNDEKKLLELLIKIEYYIRTFDFYY